MSLGNNFDCMSYLMHHKPEISYLYIHSSLNNAGLFKPKDGSNMDKPNHWVKSYIYFFNPIVGFVHILTQLWV